jgi:VIT1/CCC1 family predicted Fe2+/Mn2+ transporter
LEVAEQLTKHNALEAHARDELGINEITEAKPIIAAAASGAAFIAGGFIPVLLILIAPVNEMVLTQYIGSILILMVLGALAAKAGGSSVKKAIIRLVFWGTIAMGITALIASLFNVSV